MNRTCEKCIHYEVCRYPLEWRAFPDTCWKYEEERPHGEWLSHYEYCKKHDCIPSGLIAFWWCNKCEQGVEIPTNFCPNCGTDMTKKEGEEK